MAFWCIFHLASFSSRHFFFSIRLIQTSILSLSRHKKNVCMCYVLNSAGDDDSRKKSTTQNKVTLRKSFVFGRREKNMYQKSRLHMLIIFIRINQCHRIYIFAVHALNSLFSDGECQFTVKITIKMNSSNSIHSIRKKNRRKRTKMFLIFSHTEFRNRISTYCINYS